MEVEASSAAASRLAVLARQLSEMAPVVDEDGAGGRSSAACGAEECKAGDGVVPLPPVMRAAVVRSLKKPVAVEEVDRPVLEADDEDSVLVKLHYAGVNFADMLMCRGEYQVKPPVPFYPGAEAAGVVVAVGSGVTRVSAGDRVIVLAGAGGAYAEYALIDQDACFRLPDGMSLAAAAGCIICYGTAYCGLVRRGQLVAGETLLVTAAGGATGLAAVELGVKLGATVIAAASSDAKLAAAAAKGASVLINYSKQDLRKAVKEATDGRGVDVAFDPVGGDIFLAIVRALAWNGRAVIVGFTGGIPKVATNRLLIKNASAVGLYWGAYQQQQPDVWAADLADMLRLQPAPQLAAVFALDDINDAFAFIASRKAIGKVVLRLPGA